jgi:DNA adenine methylase
MTLSIEGEKMTHIPHPIPYQGSKRGLASKIGGLFPNNVNILYEPFAGSAAISLYAAHYDLAKRFVIGDALPSLIELWKLIVCNPLLVAREYQNIWLGQVEGDDHYFNSVRERFNEHDNPVDLLYLITRCVKNAVRFNKVGKFTQSADKRRMGMHPSKMLNAVSAASHLLKGKVEFYCGDFSDTMVSASQFDLVYMDPPYQGTTYGRDKRYFTQLEREQLIRSLRSLNERGVPFLLSYDGMSGDVVYGEALPEDLGMSRLLLKAGRSSQATLNGKNNVTIESLYVSKNIPPLAKIDLVKKVHPQSDLFVAA